MGIYIGKRRVKRWKKDKEISMEALIVLRNLLDLLFGETNPTLAIHKKPSVNAEDHNSKY